MKEQYEEKKDPAVLFYIANWLVSTAEMDGDVRGWYLNLTLHNYDKKSLPNDIEQLAVLANVKYSEFERFKQMFEQVLKQKFEQKENGRLSNEKTDRILQSRELFKEKRSDAGKLSYLIKFFKENYKKESKNQQLIQFVKENVNTEVDLKNKQMLEHMFKQVLELYININKNKNLIKDKIKGGEIQKNEIPTENEFLEYAKTILPELKIDYHQSVFSLKSKYLAWKEADWHDGNGNEILNWKTKLRNTIPFLNLQKSHNGNNVIQRTNSTFTAGAGQGNL